VSDRRPRHQSYVLRLWEVRTGGERSWRASLQSPGSSERHAFADPQSLFRFLQQAMEPPMEAYPSGGLSDGHPAGEED
jgi:hypothetical protein